MSERQIKMPVHWPDGTPRSANNAFAAAYFVRGESKPARIPPKRGPKQNPIVLRGSGLMDVHARQTN